MPQGPWSLLRHLPLRSAPAILSPGKWVYAAFQVGKGVLFFHVFTEYVLGFNSTHGVSMEPTIPHSAAGDVFILTSKLHRRGRRIKVGDVVVYTHPLFPNSRALKRVVGMPGDFVAVVTPGRRDEDIHTEDVDGKWASVKEQVVRVPDGHCWLAGDNLEWSRDSRHFGPLPLGLVKGKVLAAVRFWRWAKWLGNEGGLMDAEMDS